ncbi:DEAD/DEAH box helicase [Deinococcus yavapaiensis]|uniref:ATP-dependent RNA helicase RhlE n=1 Tax=Deinococcus yavapaiensis KR-236 TaxID=694435 RepID=A0A318S0W4_9DEIO|nr:DEAD/DEAH box helicase [Deinococcus yavapaiensis]PYE50536.1 ATP-dependent RNA helicase RhlE [Deinococcus yavapaiensis KR-236]
MPKNGFTLTQATSGAPRAASFDDFHLPDVIGQAVRDLGFTVPTDIQLKAWTPASEGHDVLGTAATGSGKTAAFLLPILTRLCRNKQAGTRALVLAPTRELAAQIETVARSLTRFTSLTVTSVYGGVSEKPQIQALRNGANIVIACPGRLLDLMRASHAHFGGLEVLVLDEADRMLDMGFLPDIKKVLAQLPRERQTMLFSATMPNAIERLARELLRTPVRIGVEKVTRANDLVELRAYHVPETSKAPLLIELLGRGEVDSAIVFTRTKHRANRVAEKLARAGVTVERIHGNRSQAQRDAALSGFKSGKYRVLVATDIAQRGIDVEELGFVVNFDVPTTPDDFVHRAGRTGRAGRAGVAITLVSPGEASDWRAIETRVERRVPRFTLPGFDVNAPGEAVERPKAERLAEMRAQKAQERARHEARRANAAAQQRPSGTSNSASVPAEPRGTRGNGRRRNSSASAATRER